MRIGIMQPYFFPYIGYFQLIHAVQTFVLNDDAAFIKQGFIHRNYLLINGSRKLFTIPLQKLSSSRSICETQLSPEKFEVWRNTFLKSVENFYRKAPYYDSTRQMIETVFDTSSQKVVDLAVGSLKTVARWLGLKAAFAQASKKYDNLHLKSQDRVLDICGIESATVYINLPGGKKLYSKAEFEKRGIQLLFLNPRPRQYRQFGYDFVPALSIIDVLMFNSKEQTKEMLTQYELE